MVQYRRERRFCRPSSSRPIHAAGARRTRPSLSFQGRCRCGDFIVEKKNASPLPRKNKNNNSSNSSGDNKRNKTKQEKKTNKNRAH